MVAHTCDCNTQEPEAGGVLQFQGQLGLPSEFKSSLNCTVRPCFKKIKKNYKHTSKRPLYQRNDKLRACIHVVKMLKILNINDKI